MSALRSNQFAVVAINSIKTRQHGLQLRSGWLQPRRSGTFLQSFKGKRPYFCRRRNFLKT